MRALVGCNGACDDDSLGHVMRAGLTSCCPVEKDASRIGHHLCLNSSDSEMD